MRINKFIASCGVASRRKAEQFITEGLVKVNNKVVTSLAFDIDETKDVVTLNDQKISLASEYVYYMLNKPKGYVTTMSDEKNRKSIIDLIGNIDNRVYPVGRLDYESEGLLFLTNDGDLTHKLTHPKFGIQKKYIVKIEGPTKESELAVLRAGVVIDGVRYSKCKAELLSFENNISRIQITLTEGKNREIRKMFEAINREVIFLKRIEMAGIKLGGLKRGEIRKLSVYEVDWLKQLVSKVK
ncbi:MAG: rRNA pseudouridine synthase [Clostridia bacterium]|nr:rRNA pseudouridine synthase [Clostridia bacterium]